MAYNNYRKQKNQKKSLFIQNDQTGTGGVSQRNNTIPLGFYAQDGITEFNAYNDRVSSLANAARWSSNLRDNDGNLINERRDEFFHGDESRESYGQGLPPNAIEIADDMAIVATSEHTQDLMYVNDEMPGCAYILVQRSWESSHGFSSSSDWKIAHGANGAEPNQLGTSDSNDFHNIALLIPYNGFTNYGKSYIDSSDRSTIPVFRYLDQLPTPPEPDYIAYKYEMDDGSGKTITYELSFDSLTQDFRYNTLNKGGPVFTSHGEEVALPGNLISPHDSPHEGARHMGSLAKVGTFVSSIDPFNGWRDNIGGSPLTYSVDGFAYNNQASGNIKNETIIANLFGGMLIDGKAKVSTGFNLDNALNAMQTVQLTDTALRSHQAIQNVFRTSNTILLLPSALVSQGGGEDSGAVEYGLAPLDLAVVDDDSYRYMRKGRVRECGKVDIYQRRRGTITAVSGNRITVAGPSGKGDILADGDIIKISSALHEETGVRGIHPLNGVKYVKKINDTQYDLYDDPQFEIGTSTAAIRGLSGVTWTHFGSTDDGGAGSWRLYDTIFSPNGMNGYEGLTKTQALKSVMDLPDLFATSSISVLNPTESEKLNDVKYHMAHHPQTIPESQSVVDAASSGRHLYDGYRFGESIDIKKQPGEDFYWLAIGEPGKTKPIFHSSMLQTDYEESADMYDAIYPHGWTDSYGKKLEKMPGTPTIDQYTLFSLFTSEHTNKGMEHMPIAYHTPKDRLLPTEYVTFKSSSSSSVRDNVTGDSYETDFETPMSDPSDDGSPTDGPPTDYSDYDYDDPTAGDSGDTTSDYGTTEGSEGTDGAVEGGDFDSSMTEPEVSDRSSEKEEPVAIPEDEVDNTEYDFTTYFTPIYRPKHEPHGRVHLYKIRIEDGSIFDIVHHGTVDASTYNPLVCAAPKFCMDYSGEAIGNPENVWATETDFSSEVTTLNGSDFNPLFFSDFASLYWYKAMVKTAQEHCLYSRFFQGALAIEDQGGGEWTEWVSHLPKGNRNFWSSGYRQSRLDVPASKQLGFDPTSHMNTLYKYNPYGVGTDPWRYHTFFKKGGYFRDTINKLGWGDQPMSGSFRGTGGTVETRKDPRDVAGKPIHGHLADAQCSSYIRPDDRTLKMKIVYRRRSMDDIGYLRNVKAWLTDRTEQYVLKYGQSGGLEDGAQLQRPQPFGFATESIKTAPAFFGGRYVWNSPREELYINEALYTELGKRALNDPSLMMADQSTPKDFALEEYIHYEILSAGYCYLDEFGKSVAIQCSENAGEIPKLAIGNNVINELGPVSTPATKQLEVYKKYIENQDNKGNPTTTWSGYDSKLIEWTNKHNAGNTNGAGVGTIHMFNIVEPIAYESNAAWQARNIHAYSDTGGFTKIRDLALSLYHFNAPFPNKSWRVDFSDLSKAEIVDYGRGPGRMSPDDSFRMIVPDIRWNDRPRGSVPARTPEGDIYYPLPITIPRRATIGVQSRGSGGVRSVGTDGRISSFDELDDVLSSGIGLANIDAVGIVRYDYHFGNTLVWKDGDLSCSDKDRILVYDHKGTTKDIKYTFKVQEFDKARSPWDFIITPDSPYWEQSLQQNFGVPGDPTPRFIIDWQDFQSLYDGFIDDWYYTFDNGINKRNKENGYDVDQIAIRRQLDYGAFGYLAGRNGLSTYNFYEKGQDFYKTLNGRTYVDPYEPNFDGTVWDFNFNPATLSESKYNNFLTKPQIAIDQLRATWYFNRIETPDTTYSASYNYTGDRTVGDSPHAMQSTHFGAVIGRNITDIQIMNTGTPRFPFRKFSASLLACGRPRTNGYNLANSRLPDAITHFPEWLNSDPASIAFFGRLDFSQNGWPHAVDKYDSLDFTRRRFIGKSSSGEETKAFADGREPGPETRTWDWNVGRWMLVPKLESGETNDNIDWVLQDPGDSGFAFNSSAFHNVFNDKGDNECIMVKYPEYDIDVLEVEGYVSNRSRNSDMISYWPATNSIYRPGLVGGAEPYQKVPRGEPDYFRADGDLLVVSKMIDHNEFGHPLPNSESVWSDTWWFNNVFRYVGNRYRFKNLHERYHAGLKREVALQVFQKDINGKYRPIQIIRAIAPQNMSGVDVLAAGSKGVDGPFAIKATSTSGRTKGQGPGYYWPLYTNRSHAERDARYGKFSWEDANGVHWSFDARMNANWQGPDMPASVHTHTFEEYPGKIFYMPTTFQRHNANSVALPGLATTIYRDGEVWWTTSGNRITDKRGMGNYSTSIGASRRNTPGMPIKEADDFNTMTPFSGIDFDGNIKSNRGKDLASFDVFSGKIILTTSDGEVALFSDSHRQTLPLLNEDTQEVRLRPYFGYEETFDYVDSSEKAAWNVTNLYDYSRKATDVLNVYQNVEDNSDGHNCFVTAFNVPLDPTAFDGNILRVITSIELEIESTIEAASYHGYRGNDGDMLSANTTVRSRFTPVVKVHNVDPRNSIELAQNKKSEFGLSDTGKFLGPAYYRGAKDTGAIVQPLETPRRSGPYWLAKYEIPVNYIVATDIVKDEFYNRNMYGNDGQGQYADSEGNTNSYVFAFDDKNKNAYTGGNREIENSLIVSISAGTSIPLIGPQFSNPEDMLDLSFRYDSEAVAQYRTGEYSSTDSIDTGAIAYSGKANKEHSISNSFRIGKAVLKYKDYDIAKIRKFNCDFYYNRSQRRYFNRSYNTSVGSFNEGLEHDLSDGNIIRIGNSESAAYFDEQNENGEPNILLGAHTSSLQVISAQYDKTAGTLIAMKPNLDLGEDAAYSERVESNYRVGQFNDKVRKDLYSTPYLPMGAYNAPSVISSSGDYVRHLSFDVHKPQRLSLHLPSYPMESGKAVLTGRGHSSISSGTSVHVSGVMGFDGNMNLQINPTPTTGNFDMTFYKPKGFECGTFGLYGPRIGGALNSGIATLVFPGGSGVSEGMTLRASNDPLIASVDLFVNVPIPVTGGLNLTSPSGHGYWNSIPCIDGNLVLMGAPSGTNTMPLHMGRWRKHEAMNLATSGPVVVSPTGADQKPSGMALNMNTRPHNSGTLYTFGVGAASSNTNLYIGRQREAAPAPLFMLQPKRLPFIDPQSPPTYEPDSEDSIQIPTLFISGSFIPTANSLNQNYSHQDKLRLPIQAFDRSSKAEPTIAATRTNSIERSRYTDQTTAGFGFRRKNSIGSTMETYSGVYAYNFYENESTRKAYDSNGKYLAIATNTTYGVPTIQVFKISNQNTVVWEFEFTGLIAELNKRGNAFPRDTQFYFKSLKISPGHKIAASLRIKRASGELRDLIIILDPEHVEKTEISRRLEDLCALEPRTLITYRTEVNEGWTINKIFFSERWNENTSATEVINKIIGNSLEWKGEDLYYDKQSAEYAGVFSRSDDDSFAAEKRQVGFSDTNDGAGYHRNGNNLPVGTKVGFGYKIKIVDDLMFVSAPMLDPYISESTLQAVNVSNPVGAVYVFTYDGFSWNYTDTVYSGGYTKDDVAGQFNCGYDLHLFGYDIDYSTDSKILAVGEPGKSTVYKFHVTDSGDARYLESYTGAGSMYAAYVALSSDSLFTSSLGLAGTILDPVHAYGFLYNRNHTAQEVRNYIPVGAKIKSFSESITSISMLNFSGVKKLFVGRDFRVNFGVDGADVINLQKFSTLEIVPENGTLYISGPGSSTRVMSIANIRGSGGFNNDLGLTTGPFAVRTSLASEDASSWNTYIPSGLAMSIEGESGTNQMPLHIRTKIEGTDPLFLKTIESWPSETTSLYTAPPYPCSGDASAYTYGSLIDKDDQKLYIRGQGAGVKDMLSETFMIMKQVDILPDSGNSNLHMQGIAAGVGSHTSDTFIFLGAGDYGPASGDTFLRLENDDPYPASGALPFAINIGSTGVANSGANLIMSGPSTVPADPPVGRGIEKNTATLFTMSTADASGALALNMPRKGVGGGEDFVSNVSLFVDNSYIALDANVYVSGGFVSSSNINLAIPSGVGLPSGSPPLFVRGYSD
tara:strand:- start:18624 stop:30425 length:11802 start_codon:yes stop_codon:yes gene_type:complete